MERQAKINKLNTVMIKSILQRRSKDKQVSISESEDKLLHGSSLVRFLSTCCEEYKRTDSLAVLARFFVDKISYGNKTQQVFIWAFLEVSTNNTGYFAIKWCLSPTLISSYTLPTPQEKNFIRGSFFVKVSQGFLARIVRRRLKETGVYHLEIPFNWSFCRIHRKLLWRCARLSITLSQLEQNGCEFCM